MNITSCPICGTHDLNCTHYFEDGIGVVEEYIDCKHCNYSFEYVYGAYQESFGRYEFHWGYSIFNKNNGEIRKFFMPIYKAKFMERRKWHKGLRNGLKVKYFKPNARGKRADMMIIDEHIPEENKRVLLEYCNAIDRSII